MICIPFVLMNNTEQKKIKSLIFDMQNATQNILNFKLLKSKKHLCLLFVNIFKLNIGDL